jgi:lipoprotein-releasing system ATP-binding protein
LRGESGSGKELLLRVLGLLEEADTGHVIVGGEMVHPLNETARAELRRRHFGYLFAAPFLLPGFTVIENVVMPMFKVLDAGPAEARARAEELLAFADIQQLDKASAGSLNTFDQRRVALVRALATSPAVLLVEESDRDLTPEQQKQFARLLRDACVRWQVTVVSTASLTWVPLHGDHVYDISGGKVMLAHHDMPHD